MRFSNIYGVKILGRSIGAARSVASEVDGDGDGFLTGLDGRDNVPAPKRVTNAAKNAGQVADILKPTDDLMEVRKSGRPWKPLLLEHQPKEWLDEYKKVTREAQQRMIARAKKKKELQDEWKKKYGWNGREGLDDVSVIPEDVREEGFKYWAIQLDARVGDTDLIERIDALDKQLKKNIQDKFLEQEDKARQTDKADKFYKDFKVLEKYLFREQQFLRDMDIKLRIQDYAKHAFLFTEQRGDLVPGEDGDQFELAAKKAKDAVSNADKRIVIHGDLKMLEGILKDGKIKNFFQAKRNMFIDAYDEMAAYDKWGAAERKRAYMNIRLRTEQWAMGIPRSGFEAKNRPIYAFFMPDGVISPPAVKGKEGLYGAIGIVMKHDVESRSRFTVGDSANQEHVGASPINDPGMGLGTMAKGGLSFGNKNEINRLNAGGGYAEAQIFGGVSVKDISYINLADDVELPPSVLETLRKLDIPVMKHKETTPFVEPEELRMKADVVSEGFVLFATRNNDKLFVPNKRPKEGDLSGMISLDGKKAKPVENVLSVLNFGYWELV